MTVRISDEETPLLEQTKQAPTPLPWFQFSIVLFSELAGSLTSQAMYPIVPQLIRDLGITNGKESQVAYYQSAFALTQAFTVLLWSWLSDRVGRKPVILTGLAGLSLSMYCFGLSKTFRGLLLSQILNGALNGNIGVIKSLIGELTDETNISKAYGYMPIAFSTSGTLGPIIGGSLSRPAERFPKWFGNSVLLKEYPYFLSCAIPATFSLLAWISAFLFLKETVRAPIGVSELFGFNNGNVAQVEEVGDVPTAPLGGTAQSPLRGPMPTSHQGRVIDNNTNLDDFASVVEEKPLPLRSLLTRRVIIAAGNYATLSLVDTSFRAIQPVFLSTPIHLGGLGLPPSTIGNLLSIFGVLNGVFQVFFFAQIHDRWGSKRVFIAGIAAALPAFASFPVINYLARAQGYSMMVWTAVGFQILTSVALGLSHGAVYIFITHASPNRASLGATNGLCRTSVTTVRAIGLAVASSLFSVSIDKGYLGGQLVYLVLFSFAAVSIFIGCCSLPSNE
ncbi:hypothetical protein D9619_004779 [Psilocybe cf. subviscida]|uniref:Major facilitator superfamily (MFS) profile domain-containing protein n=1 Tax=Psilocybe cf. subviscida TaxID=2480587 RepID=A0A8H5F980_9AGAR|nr:hypothetical protein D9619_004779 [Psilocybe cf. subviscida]